MSTELPQIVRLEYQFSVDTDPEEIERRIAETRADAQIIALQAYDTRAQQLSELYAPVNEDDLHGNIGYPCALDWREALSQCIVGRLAKYVAIVRPFEMPVAVEVEETQPAVEGAAIA